MTSAILTQSELAELVSTLVAKGTRVIAPVLVEPGGDQAEYRPIRRLGEAELLAGLPRRSLKEFFRPPLDGHAGAGSQVVLGARPCDAAGVVNLDNVMGLEYGDEQWLARRAATTIVSVACPGVDGACFCDAVQLGPDSTAGADALLVPLNRPPAPAPSQRQVLDSMRRAVGLFLVSSEPFPEAAALQAEAERAERAAALRFLATPVTPRGAALLRGLGAPLRSAADYRSASGFVRQAREQVTANLAAARLTRPRRSPAASFEERLRISAADGGQLLDPEATLPAAEETSLDLLPTWLARHHDHDLWRGLAERCQGCGTCTAVCSTSPCFDLEDGDDRRGRAAARRGERTEPFQQRVMHKFSTYPRRFHSLLCTGCGRCTRSCSAGMNLPEVLGRCVQLAAAEAIGAAT